MPRVRRRSISDILSTRSRLEGQLYATDQPYLSASSTTARRNRINRIADTYIRNITSLRPVRNMMRAQTNPNLSADAVRTLQRRVVNTSFSRNTYAGVSRGVING